MDDSAKVRFAPQSGRSEKSSNGEPAPHIVVGPPASERFDVPQFAPWSHPAGRTGERIRAAYAAGGIGRRGQFADQRYRSVPPIPACSATPAASATRRRSRRLAKTLRCRRSSTHRSVHHRHARSRPTRARHSASSAQIGLTQKGGRSAAAAGHRSARLRGFAGAVSAIDPSVRRRIELDISHRLTDIRTFRESQFLKAEHPIRNGERPLPLSSER
jgi:hypothetical protein